MKISLTFCSVVAIIAVVSVTASRSDYCSLCPGHIACNHNNLFDRSCPRDAEMVAVTESLKQAMIQGHNNKRNFIAGGGDRKFRPACAMTAMKWDNELAELAALNVKQCKMRHDACRDTAKFQMAGQNIYYKGIPVNGPETFVDEQEFREAIDSWYSEIKDCDQNIIDRFPENYYGPVITHFTGMMLEHNTHLGCAAATYTENGMNMFLVTCNYAAMTMVGAPVYVSCNQPASKCTSGRHNVFKNLCN